MKRQKWDSDNITGQEGKVAIVTGSSSGIGFETARVLADKNATVIIAVRNRQKGSNALQAIKKQHKHADLEVMELDLANLKSVKAFTAAFKKKYKRLDILINNAGVMVPPYTKTADGFELQMGTNHMGHFALTAGLMELIKNTKGSRIVNVSSTAHKIGNIDLNDLNWEKRKYKKWKAYGDSKIANLYFTYQLQRQFNSRKLKVIAVAAHPGWTATDLQRHTGSVNFMNKFFAQGIDMGALPTLYAAVAEDVKGGDFYGPSGFMEMKGYPKKVKSKKLSHDENRAVFLWELSKQKTGIDFHF